MPCGMRAEGHRLFVSLPLATFLHFVQDRGAPWAAGDIILWYVVFFSYFCILFYQYQKEQER